MHVRGARVSPQLVRARSISLRSRRTRHTQYATRARCSAHTLLVLVVLALVIELDGLELLEDLLPELRIGGDVSLLSQRLQDFGGHDLGR